MAKTAHGGLDANTVLAVEVEPGWDGLVVVNRSLEGVIWCRIDGEDPVPTGPGTYAVFGSRYFQLTRTQLQSGPVTVKMISDAPRAFTVEAVG